MCIACSDMVFLTGTRDQVAVATRAYRVYFSKADEHEDDEDDYLVDHSIVLYLVAPDGEFLDFFTQKMQVGDVTKRILNHVKTWKPQPPSQTTPQTQTQTLTNTASK